MKTGLAALIGPAWTMSSCSVHGPYEFQGLGVGTDCNFTDEFAGIMTCESLAGTSLSPFAVEELYWESTPAGALLGLASSKPIEKLEGDIIVSSQIDDTVAMALLDIRELETRITVHAVDGSKSKCLIAPSKGIILRCDDW